MLLWLWQHSMRRSAGAEVVVSCCVWGRALEDSLLVVWCCRFLTHFINRSQKSVAYLPKTF